MFSSSFALQGNSGEEGVDGLDGEQVQKVSHSVFHSCTSLAFSSLFILFIISLEILTCVLNSLKLIFALIFKIQGL